MFGPREITTELRLDSRPLTVEDRKQAAAVLRNLAEDVHLVNADAAAEFLSSSDGRFLVNVWSRLRLQRTNRELVRRIHKVLGWLGAIVEFALQPPSRRPHFPDREQIVRACLGAADALDPPQAVSQGDRVCHAAADALAGPQAASAGDESDDSSPTKAKRST
ncbi:MAG: hypothetical protein L6Q92_17195, partial [Phycisphaerae bacterium]|nr:hypothetical protein [Phycisphaerae bacterium]